MMPPHSVPEAMGVVIVVAVVCGLGLYGLYGLADWLYKIWAGDGMNGM